MNEQAVQLEELCRQRANLAAYIDGELSPAEELELEMHLGVCPACAAELNEQKKLLQALNYALDGEEPIALPEDFTRVVVTNAESRVSGLRRPQERFKALFVCAALFLLTLLAFGTETKTILQTFARFAEQMLAVGGFVWNLIYDVSVGTAIILRSLSHQIIHNSSFAVAVFVAFLFVFVVLLSSLATRQNRF